MLNAKFKVSLLVAILLTQAGTAYAGALPVGCYPKPKVSAFLAENHQGQIDQFKGETKKGVRKITVTAEHDGTGYVQDGSAYMIASDDKEACIISKMRIDNDPQKKQILIESVHEFGGKERTSKEWKKISDFTQKDPEKLKAEWKQKGMTEQDVEEGMKVVSLMSKGGTDDTDAKLLYQIKENGTVSPLKRDF